MLRRLWLLAATAGLMSVGVLVGGSAVSAQAGGYISMGDSVAAGAGLPLVSGAYSEDQTCDRSGYAYPNYVSAELGIPITQLACTGAKLDEGIYGEQERASLEIMPQLDRAFENGTPELITITVGANDARWIQALYHCYSSNCDSRTASVAFRVLLADMRLELGHTLRRIERLSGDNPPVVLVTGYYNPLSERDCIDTDRITDGEWDWIDDRAEALNDSIERVVDRRDFARFVPVDFSGHGLCSDEPWVQGLSGEAPFHPTISGQQAIADSVVEAYRQMPDQVDADVVDT